MINLFCNKEFSIFPVNYSSHLKSQNFIPSLIVIIQKTETNGQILDNLIVKHQV